MTLVDRLRDSYKLRELGSAGMNVLRAVRAQARRLRLRSQIAQRPVVNIHFGCGEIADARFINIDARPLPHVHLVTTSPLLRPIPDGCADIFYACHVFEHISFLAQHGVLKRWFELLKPGGRLMLSVPDFDKLVDTFIASSRAPTSIQQALMGGQDYSGNFHYAIFTRPHLKSLLQAAGFVQIDSWHPREEHSWPQDWSWADDVSLNMSARRPG